MSDAETKPPLTPEETASAISMIRWQLANLPVTDGWPAFAKALLDEYDRHRAQVAQQLAGLLLHSLHKLPADNPYRELGEACNGSVRAAATALGITLP